MGPVSLSSEDGGPTGAGAEDTIVGSKDKLTRNIDGKFFADPTKHTHNEDEKPARRLGRSISLSGLVFVGRSSCFLDEEQRERPASERLEAMHGSKNLSDPLCAQMAARSVGGRWERYMYPRGGSY